MANAFGRDCPWTGGTGPPPSKSKHATGTPNQEDSRVPISKHMVQKWAQKEDNTPTAIVRVTPMKTKKAFSQSFLTCLKAKQLKSTLEAMKQPSPQAVTPDKAEKPQLSVIGTMNRTSTFFTPKRKKSDEDTTEWTKEKLTDEIKRHQVSDGQHTNIDHMNHQELRKTLFQLISTKKQKKEEEGTMDIGKILMDSTMDYIPNLCEDSTDEEIKSLEKHDAILELANFIQKCGKRANMYKLNNTSLEEIHENLILARDEHKSVKLVFPELQGQDAKWFGPRSDRNDKDYEEGSLSSKKQLKDAQLDDDWWDDIPVEEIENLHTEEETKIDKKAQLQQEHDKLFQQLLNEASKNSEVKPQPPDETLKWNKEQFATAIVTLGKKLGKTIYYSVAMNQTKEKLRAQHDTLVKQVKEMKPVPQASNKSQNPGEDGEYEWTDENECKIICEKKNENETKNKKEEKSIKIKKEQKEQTNEDVNEDTPQNVTSPKNVNEAKKDSAGEKESENKTYTTKKAEENEGLTIFTRKTPDEIIEILERFTMISIIFKRMKDDVKPLDFMLKSTMKELQDMLKYFKPLMGIEEIRVTRKDEEYHRKREEQWGPNSEWGKLQAQHEKNWEEVPKSKKTPPNKSQAKSNHSPTQPSSQEPPEAHLPMDTSDMKGVDISMFTPKGSSQFNINEPPDENKQSKSDVVTLVQRTFNMRVSYGLKHRGHHTPTDIKNFVSVLRTIDPNVKILPFELEAEAGRNDHDVITHENNLPDTQDAIEKYATSIEISYNNKLHFGMRASSTLTFPELRRLLFSWCSKTRSYVKFDNIRSKKIFGLGWILGIHPSYHNRNALKSILFKNAPDLLDKVSIYPRRVWQESDDKTERTTTNGVVIDGCIEHRDRIIQHLCSYKWTGPYAQATFIPFKITEEFTLQHQQRAMQEQNIFLRDLWSKIVHVNDSTGLLTCCETGKKFTFITWLTLCEIHGKRILKSVEYIDKKRVRILYHKSNEFNVCNMLTHLFPAIEQQFGEEKAVMLLGNKDNQMRQIKTKCMEHSYAGACAKNIMQRGNPQEEVVNNPPKVKFNSYFGQNKRDNEKRETNKTSNNEQRENTKQRGQNFTAENETNETVEELRKAIALLQANQSKQTQIISELNEQLHKKNNPPTEEEMDDTRANHNDMQEEIQALWTSQDEKYASLKEELSREFNEKIEKTKTKLQDAIDETNSSIKKEIEVLKSLQEASTTSLREQQVVHSTNILDAIGKLTTRMDSFHSQPPTTSNPPISPVEQGSRHGGYQ